MNTDNFETVLSEIAAGRFDELAVIGGDMPWLHYTLLDRVDRRHNLTALEACKLAKVIHEQGLRDDVQVRPFSRARLAMWRSGCITAWAAESGSNGTHTLHRGG